MSGKFALIIANAEYSDPGLVQLTAPSKDAEDLARILRDKEIAAFDDVNILLNQASSTAIEAIDEFFNQKKPDDLLVLYFSGHGVRDELGLLYLAVKNTNRSKLRSTAIRTDYIREAMDQSRSKRQVLILDCCNSGAFPQGTKAEIGGAMGMISAFQGYGRFVLTASDATQFAWEGDKVIGETQNSLFTHFLVKGLEGEADSDSDGRITVDELYDYAYEQISRITPKQTPTKSATKQEGEIVLRQITRIEDIRPISLPDQLISEIENPYPEVRLRAVQQLAKLLTGKNMGLVRSARESLERIEAEDDSRRVSLAATQMLEPIREADQKANEEQKVKEEAERRAKKEEAQLLAAQKVEQERVEREKTEAESTVQEESKRLTLQKAEEERLAREKIAVDRKAREAAQRLAVITEEDQLAKEKAGTERKAKEESQRLAVQKNEEERLARERAKAQQDAIKKVAVKKNKPIQYTLLPIGIAGIVIVTVLFCGYAVMKFIPSILGAPAATLPVATQAPTSAPTALATEAPTTAPTAIATEALTPTPIVFNPHPDSSDYIDPFGVPMRLVPAGDFIMGSNNGNVDEKPIHTVYLDNFYIDKYEFTVALYQVCINDGVCPGSFNEDYYNKNKDHPVVDFEEPQASAFCMWRNARLPTEAEWEKAARGTDGRTYPWGEGISCDKANYEGCVGDTTAVGSYESGKSFYGVYDMAGNVWEWVTDFYQSDYYSTLGQDAINPLGPSSGTQHILRGGGFFNVTFLSTSNQSRSSLRFHLEGFVSGITGFRCAKNATP